MMNTEPENSTRAHGKPELPTNIGDSEAYRLGHHDAMMEYQPLAEEMEAHAAQLAEALRQAREALASIEGKARTMKIVNAFCRSDNAVAAYESEVQ